MTAIQRILCRVTVASLLALIPTGQQAMAGRLKVQEVTLANGLKVLLVEEHKAPVITVQIWYKVGSRNEVMGRAGLSHMLEHMMFKGTPKYGKGAFSKMIEKNGGNDNAFTSQDYTAYFENLAANKLELTLEMEADRMKGLLLDEKEFQLEREVVKEERRLRVEDVPMAYLVEQMYAQAFMVHPYHWPIIGWFNDLDAMTREDLKAYYDKYYVPNNATLVIVGDVKAETALPVIKKYFEGIPQGSLPAPPSIVEPVQKGERRIVVKREAQLPFIYFGYKVPNFESPDVHALAVLENILSTGKSARLYDALVYREKLALQVGAGYNELATDPEFFTFYAIVKPGVKIADVEKAVLAEIERLKKEPPTEKELQKAKNQVEARYLFEQDSVFRQAMLLGTAETVGAGWQYIADYVDKLRGVTKEDVHRVARTYLNEDTRTVGILIPLPAKSERAQAAGGAR
ncbi:MAG TPA: pitrilysin family protein [Nitrospirales bacterium]|nr:pitrilysin family protein [Nitrospirales bacterium]